MIDTMGSFRDSLSNIGNDDDDEIFMPVTSDATRVPVREKRTESLLLLKDKQLRDSFNELLELLEDCDDDDDGVVPANLKNSLLSRISNARCGNASNDDSLHLKEVFCKNHCTSDNSGPGKAEQPELASDTTPKIPTRLPLGESISHSPQVSPTQRSRISRSISNLSPSKATKLGRTGLVLDLVINELLADGDESQSSLSFADEPLLGSVDHRSFVDRANAASRRRRRANALPKTKKRLNSQTRPRDNENCSLSHVDRQSYESDVSSISCSVDYSSSMSSLGYDDEPASPAPKVKKSTATFATCDTTLGASMSSISCSSMSSLESFDASSRGVGRSSKCSSKIPVSLNKTLHSASTKSIDTMPRMPTRRREEESPRMPSRHREEDEVDQPVATPASTSEASPELGYRTTHHSDSPRKSMTRGVGRSLSSDNMDMQHETLKPRRGRRAPKRVSIGHCYQSRVEDI